MVNSKIVFSLVGIGAFIATFAGLVAAEDTDKALLERAQQMFKPLPADAGTPERPLTPERGELG